MLDQTYCAIYSIYNYPSDVALEWLRRILQMENVMVSVFKDNGDKGRLIKDIDYTIQEENKRIFAKQDTELTQAQNADANIQRLLKLSDRLQTENISVSDITVYLYVYAENEKKLEERCQNVEGKLSGRRMTVRRISNMQESGFDAFLPVMKNPWKEMTAQQMPTDAFLAGLGFVPFFGINDPNGIFLGVDNSANPVFLDTWALSHAKTNGNLAVLGKPGSGKSATVKALLAHELAAGTRLLILDAEREYLSFADAFGGNIIDPSGGVNADGSRSIINPLQLTDFPKEWDDPRIKWEDIIKSYKTDPAFQGSITVNIKRLRKWFSIYLNETNNYHLAVLEKALYETYKRKGLTEISDPRTMKNSDSPPLDDDSVTLYSPFTNVIVYSPNGRATS